MAYPFLLVIACFTPRFDGQMGAPDLLRGLDLRTSGRCKNAYLHVKAAYLIERAA